MGTFGKVLSLVGFLVGLTISILMYAQYSDAQSGIMGALSDRMHGSRTYVKGSSGTSDAPVLDVEKIPAPANGSSSRDFEIVHVDEDAQPGELVELNDTTEDDFGKASDEDVDAELSGPPEDADIGELAMYYWGRLSTWLFGEREEKVEMSCKTKKDGGKVCTVIRK